MEHRMPCDITLLAVAINSDVKFHRAVGVDRTVRVMLGWLQRGIGITGTRLGCLVALARFSKQRLASRGSPFL